MSRRLSKYTLEQFFILLGKGYNRPNSGGCGMFAYAASRALDSLNISHTIIVQCHDNYDLITFQEKYGSIGKSINKVYQKYLSDVNENNSLANIYGIHCHIVIRVNGVDYDAEGCKRSLYQRPYNKY